MNNLNEYRVTRTTLYVGNCPGNSPCGRQGHYILAVSAEEAAKTASERFPEELFDVQAWNTKGFSRGTMLLKNYDPNSMGGN